MSNDDTSTEETAQSDADQTDTSCPMLTLRAAGPATYKRQIEDSEYVDGVAIHQDVVVTISRLLRGPSEFYEFVDVDQRGTPIVDRQQIVDQLLAGRGEGYSRSGPLTEWSITVEGTASNWKRLALAIAGDRDSESERQVTGAETAEAAVRILHALIDGGITDSGASLAVLELVDEHELSVDCTPFVEQIDDGQLGDE